jgi:menaquinone-dependent protoporphyrinogen IX oxidase
LRKPKIEECSVKVAIVHDSQAGNGERLAHTMREAFEASGATVTVGHVKDIDPESIVAEEPDLLVVGAAIRAFMTSRTSKRWIRGLSRSLQATKSTVRHAAVFVTHGLPVDKAAGWGRRFRKRLDRMPRVEKVYPDWLSGRVVGQLGPLQDGAEETFRDHAEKLLEWAAE